MKILAHNLIDDYDPADFSSERANFWASNVKIHHLIVPWRTLIPDTQYYTLDAGAGLTITADCAAIAGHNLSSGATIKIMAHPTNDWGAPDLEETFTWGAGPMMAFFASTAKRFWRFEIDDPTNPDGYLQIGRLGLGAALQMPPIEPGAELPVITTSQASTSSTGNVFGNRGRLLLAPAFSLPIISQAERTAILAMFEDVHNIVPVFLAVWEDSLTVQAPIYCRIDQESLEFKKTPEAGVLWQLEIAFREVT
jgi:hypothetical protein